MGGRMIYVVMVDVSYNNTNRVKPGDGSIYIYIYIYKDVCAIACLRLALCCGILQVSTRACP